MSKPDFPRPPGDVTFKDSITCGAVLATMVFTIACGAFVVDTGTDTSATYAQLATETAHD